eukprot:TRINITY_DN8969_c0_g1_i1.p1 TRINITY_DN8969_c0_g1~~TRINITY_DN8969_c0_g1_i1.p1  ORF type:complete len:270 (+),score=52.43 TRINITY_DN8969_c0_g1_i1:14-823(+)
MVLYLIGLGLGDEKDITVKGAEAIQKCSFIYLECYTSILGVSKEKLEAYYNKKIIEADREKVEQEADEIIDNAKTNDVAFLVVGDPFGATTHTDLVIRAKQKNVKVEVIHNASIMNAIGATGLQLYNFGSTVSIVFWTDTWRPDSFYHKIKQNADLGLHTLCLLDIKVKEQSTENLLRNRKIYEPPRFMTVNQCVEQLLESEKNNNLGVCTPATRCFGVARIGREDQLIVSGTMEEVLTVDFGAPLHSFVICGHMHELEEEFYNFYKKK